MHRSIHYVERGAFWLQALQSGKANAQQFMSILQKGDASPLLPVYTADCFAPAFIRGQRPAPEGYAKAMQRLCKCFAPLPCHEPPPARGPAKLGCLERLESPGGESNLRQIELRSVSLAWVAFQRLQDLARDQKPWTRRPLD